MPRQASAPSPTWALVALLAAPLLAGCLSLGDPAALDPAQASGALPLDVEPRLGMASGLPLERPTGPAGLDAPPRWALGEWWRVRAESLAFPAAMEVTVVVAGQQPGHYLLGMPVGEFQDAVLVFHFPCLGEVVMATLGCDAHDLPWQPLRFPLVEGQAWTTLWYSGTPMEGRVAAVAEDGRTAEVELAHPTRHTTLTYDADLGAIREMHVQDYLHMEVLDHGFGYQGEVRVPYGQDLVVCHGRTTLVGVIDGCGLDPVPRLPAETIPLRGPYDRLSFALLATAGPGLMAIQVEAPDGTLYQLARDPRSGAAALAAHGHGGAVGDWTLRASAAGQGTVLFEGPAYRVLDVTLP